MVKATEFWKFVCEDMDYRIFSGVPCLGLKALYDKMNPKIMHYIPAVNEHTAFGISLGATTSGAKSGVIVDAQYLDMVEDWMKFCFDHKNHLIIITNNDLKRKIAKIVFDGDYKKLKTFLNKKSKEGKPAIIVLEGTK